MSESAFVLEELGVSLLREKRWEVVCLVRANYQDQSERWCHFDKGAGHGNETEDGAHCGEEMARLHPGWDMGRRQYGRH